MQNESSSTAMSARWVGPASQIRCQFGLNPCLVFIAKNEIQCGSFLRFKCKVLVFRILSWKVVVLCYQLGSHANPARRTRCALEWYCSAMAYYFQRRCCQEGVPESAHDEGGLYVSTSFVAVWLPQIGRECGQRGKRQGDEKGRKMTHGQVIEAEMDKWPKWLSLDEQVLWPQMHLTPR